jgi:hypothetical protein
MFRRVVSLAFVVAVLLGGSAAASAQTMTTPHISHAYPKGSNFDVVVKFNPKVKLTIFLNDRHKGHAKFDKQGWATFKNVPLQSQGNIYFSKLTIKGYKQNGKVIYYQKSGSEVTFYAPKYSYDEFAKWLTANAAVEHYWKYDGIGDRNINVYNFINSKCHTTGDWSRPEWKACMQDAYKKYLKPETFATEQGMNDFLSVVGVVESKFGDFQSFASQDDIKTAQTTYAQLAVAD